MQAKSESEVAQLCPTLHDAMDYIAHQAPLSMGFFQARVLEWVATGVGFLLQGIFLHWQADSLPLSDQGIPYNICPRFVGPYSHDHIITGKYLAF